MVLARYEIVGSWKMVDDYVPAIRKVTPEDIQRVTQKYLLPGNRTVGILIPLPPQGGWTGQGRAHSQVRRKG